MNNQTHTLLATCQAGANGFVDNTGVAQCFDPQLAVVNPRR